MRVIVWYDDYDGDGGFHVDSGDIGGGDGNDKGCGDKVTGDSGDDNAGVEGNGCCFARSGSCGDNIVEMDSGGGDGSVITVGRCMARVPTPPPTPLPPTPPPARR